MSLLESLPGSRSLGNSSRRSQTNTEPISNPLKGPASIREQGLILQRRELSLDGVHGQDQGVAEILLVQAHELVISRFVREYKGAALEDRGC